MDRSALERELERLLERHRERPEGRAFAPLADCHRKLGQFDEALELLREGLQRHPDYNAARVILGKLHEDCGEPELARVAYASALELDPFNLVARRLIARVCEELGNAVEARGHWEQLLNNDRGASDAEEALERLRDAEPAAPPVEPKQSQPPRPEIAVLHASLEPDDEDDEEDEEDAGASAEAPKPSGQPVPAPSVAARVASASSPEGIVTVTLARIYRAQGFAARALEIYEELQRAAPQPEFAQAIQELGEELGRREPVTPRAIEDFTPGRPIEVPLPREPLAEVALEAAGREEPVATGNAPSVEDFDHFRAWLDRIKVRG